MYDYKILVINCATIICNQLLNYYYYSSLIKNLVTLYRKYHRTKYKGRSLDGGLINCIWYSGREITNKYCNFFYEDVVYFIFEFVSNIIF